MISRTKCRPMREACARGLFAKVPERLIPNVRARWLRVSRRLEMTTPRQRSVPAYDQLERQSDVIFAKIDRS